MIDQAIYSLLINSVEVSAIVGSRVYPVALPQGVTLPAISFHKISVTGRELSHTGPAKAATARFQFSCWSGTQETGKELAAAVIKLFHGYVGTVGSEKIYSCQVVNEVDLFDFDLGLQVAVDVLVDHKENF